MFDFLSCFLCPVLSLLTPSGLVVLLLLGYGFQLPHLLAGYRGLTGLATATPHIKESVLDDTTSLRYIPKVR